MQPLSITILKERMPSTGAWENARNTFVSVCGLLRFYGFCHGYSQQLKSNKGS